MYEVGAAEQHILSRRRKALEALLAFDPVHPGRGRDGHTGNQILDHAMAYALFASSARYLGLHEEATNARSWLIDDAAKPDGQTGWGLPFSWDAFADGDPNPIETIYGITTALAVRALLDCAEKGKVPVQAISALENYLRFSNRTDDGVYFWYSNQRCDAKSVFNVTAMLAGQYARAGFLLGRNDFMQIAEAAAKDIVANRRQSRNGFYWNYGPEVARPNDAVHAAYTVLGLLEVQRWLGIDLDLKTATMYLRKFFRDGKPYEFVRHDGLEEKRFKKAARPWGVGALLMVACEAEDKHLQSLSEAYLADRSTYVVTDELFFPRQFAHIAWGLARSSLKMGETQATQPNLDEGEESARQASYRIFGFEWRRRRQPRDQNGKGC